MSTILLLTGSTRGDALGAVLRGTGKLFEQFGFEAVEVNLGKDNAYLTLNELIRTREILFAFTAAGIGRDIAIDGEDGKQRNLWEALGVPFISMNGDTPAYFFDRHVNPGANFASLYSFREHYTLRKRLPHLNGLTGLALPFGYDPVARESLDFGLKEKGKLLFLKNGNDPKALQAMWKASCRPYILKTLLELADLLENNMATDPHVDLDALVCEAFKTKGLDVDALFKLRLFFVAQLDDYLRRVKATFMAEVLSNFPVEIRGDNWGHVDFSGKACTFIGGCDYVQSRTLIQQNLGVIDMSPNTGGGFHDRMMRSFGAHTICITNEQECVSDSLPESEIITFRFDRESLEQRVNEVLTNPKDYVELGIEFSRQFNEQFPAETFVRSLLEGADAMRLATSGRITGLQEFFAWPPELL